MRLLTRHRLEHDPVVGRTQTCAHELVALGVPPDRRGETPLLVQRTRLRHPLEGKYGRPHEELASDEGGDGIAGQTEDERVTARPEGERLARFDRYTPEDFLDPKVQGAEIQFTYYAQAETDSRQYTPDAIKNDPIIYPSTDTLKPLETRKATPAGQRARDQIFAEFKAA